jgi:thiol-disulfide isomerase/thioredoxin
MTRLVFRCLAVLAWGVGGGVLVGCAGAAVEPASLLSSVGSEKPADRGQALIDPGSLGIPSLAPVAVPGWLGVALTAQPTGRPGVVVSSVLRRSPAAVGGLEVGDVVVGVNDTRVNQPGELSQRVAELGAGERANLMVERAGAPRLLAVQLGENPGFEGQLRLGFVDANAPELEGVSVARGALGPTLGALRGRVVVLEFWATWCGACRALLPTLNAWQERYQPSGALVVSVTTDPVEKAARDAAELGLIYPVLSDPDGLTAQAYQAFALPTLFVIDRAGVVRDVSVGYDPQRIAEIEATVARLLSDS